MIKKVDIVENLINTKLDGFAYPDGIRHCCNAREIEFITLVGNKYKEELKILNRNSNLTFEEIEKCYHILMDSSFGEKIIEKAEIAYEKAWEYEKEEIENFIEDIRANIEYSKKHLEEYKKMIEIAKKGNIAHKKQ